MTVRYYPCNRCGKKGVHVCSGIGLPGAFWNDSNPPLGTLYVWNHHLACRYCHWHHIIYVTAPYTHTGDEALASALRQFGVAPGGLVTRNYWRHSLPYGEWLAAGGESLTR